MSQARPLRIAIAGLDSTGRFYLESWLDSPDLMVVVAYDPDPDVRNACAHLCERFVADFDGVLSSADVDAVLLNAESADRLRQACQVLAAGKHVVIPHPPAMNVEAALRLREAANAARRSVICWSHLTDHEDFAAAQAVANSDGIGELRFLRFDRGDFAPLPASREESNVCRSVLGEVLDQCLRLVRRQALKVFAQPIGESGMTVTIRFTDDLVGLLTLGTGIGRNAGGWSIDADGGGYANGRRWIRKPDGEIFDAVVEPEPSPTLVTVLRDVVEGRTTDAAHDGLVHRAAVYEALMRSLASGEAIDVEALGLPPGEGMGLYTNREEPW